MKNQNFIFLFCLLTFSINSFPQTSWPSKIRVHYKTATNQVIDNIIIRFSSDPSVTTAESLYWDARSLNCCTFIASLKGSVNFAIQTRPINFTNDTVKLLVASTATGSFKLLFTDFEYFSVAKQIILLDNYTGTQQEVKANPSYDFAINSDANSQGADRFKLVFVSEQLVIQCPPNIVSNHSFGTNGGNVLFNIPVTLAKCAQPYIDFSHLPGSFFPIGNTTVTVNAYDLCGNTSNCSFIVTVKDIEPPLMNSPLPLYFSTDPGTSTYSFIPTPPLATDNHKMKVVEGVRSDNKSLDQPYSIGTTKITWNASDSSGNITSVMQFITVKDTEAPVISAADVEYNAGLYTCSAAINNDIQVTDNSVTVNYTGLRNDGAALNDLYPIGITTITWTASDAFGNTATSIQQITVKDNVAPIITPVNNNLIVANLNGCKANISNMAFDPQVYDNCTVVSLKNNYNNTSSLSGTILPQGITNILWTAVDGSGNTSSWLQVIEVTTPAMQINIPDVFVLPGNTDANTIYLGYAPTSVITYNTTVVGATSYLWSVSSNLSISGANNNSTVKVTANATSSLAPTLTLKASNNIGCSVTATKQLQVVDISCGKNKVMICSPLFKEMCVNDKTLKSYLQTGYKLGYCNSTQQKTSSPSFVMAEKTFKIYPNPGSGIFNLQLNNYQNTKMEVRITDVMGKLIAVKSLVISNSVEIVPFNIVKHPAGVYNVQFISETGVQSTKIIVAR